MKGQRNYSLVNQGYIEGKHILQNLWMKISYRIQTHQLMKRFLLIYTFILPLVVCSQNIGINTTGATPNTSAILDIDADGASKAGILIPRLTVAERNSIASPAMSLLIFNLTSGRYEFFNGSIWVPIAAGGTLDDLYDAGGVGAGRTIVADAGALTIAGTDGIVSTGNGFSGATAPSGSGVRMVWNPKKAAFRAGQVTSTQWDEGFIGSHSTAFGFNSISNGSSSFSAGSGSQASGFASVAMGNTNVAIGSFSTSFGSTNFSLGSSSTSLGQGNTAGSFCEVTFGSFSSTGTVISGTSLNVNDRVLTIGNGTGTSARSNALVLMKSGNLGLGSDSPTNLIHMKKAVSGEVSMRIEETSPSGTVFSQSNITTTGVNLNASVVASWTGAINAANSFDNIVWTGGLADEGQFSDFLDISFQFNASAFPAGATILGVVIHNTRRASDTDDIKDNVISLKVGSIVGQNKLSSSYWPTFNSTSTYGSSSDNWGLTITPAALTSGQLGLRIQYLRDNDFFSSGLEQGFVDRVLAQVFYSDPANVVSSSWSIGSLGSEFKINDASTLAVEPELVIGTDGVTTLKGLRLANGAADGNVLTSDASGNAVWQANTGLQDLALNVNELSLSSSAVTVDLSPYAGWSFAGNTITNPEVEFIGTTSNHDLNLKSNNATRLTLKNSGFIGVNTSSPTRLFHIVDNTSSTTSGQLYIEQAGTGNAFMHIGKSGARHYSIGMDATDSKFKIATNAASPGTLSSTQLFTIQPTGEVGIGTSLPSQKLHIQDSGQVIARISTTSINASTLVGIDFDKNAFFSNDWRIYSSNSTLTLGLSTDNFTTVLDRYQFGDVAFVPSSNGTQNLGGSSNRWNTLFATNGTINTSDIREKTNVHSIGYGLSEVMLMNPVRFTWKERPEEGEKLGLIAQELQEILPEVVRDWDWKEDEQGNKTKVEAERLGVYYSDLIPVLIKAIQEQQESIDQLKSQIKALENQ